MFVKPAPGLKVPDPDTFVPLPAEGRDVPDNTYWRRRLRDGDVIAVEEDASTASSEPTKEG